MEGYAYLSVRSTGAQIASVLNNVGQRWTSLYVLGGQVNPDEVLLVELEDLIGEEYADVLDTHRFKVVPVLSSLVLHPYLQPGLASNLA